MTAPVGTPPGWTGAGAGAPRAAPGGTGQPAAPHLAWRRAMESAQCADWFAARSPGPAAAATGARAAPGPAAPARALPAAAARHRAREPEAAGSGVAAPPAALGSQELTLLVRELVEGSLAAPGAPAGPCLLAPESAPALAPEGAPLLPAAAGGPAPQPLRGVAAAAGRAGPAGRATPSTPPSPSPRSAPGPEPLVRWHAEWSEEGLRLWLGAHPALPLAGLVEALVRALAPECAQRGTRLLAVTCNGQPAWQAAPEPPFPEGRAPTSTAPEEP